MPELHETPSEKKIKIGVGKMAKWLGVLSALAEGPSLVHNTALASSQPPVPPASGSQHPLLASISTYTHTHTHMYTHTCRPNKNLKQILYTRYNITTCYRSYI